MLSSGLNAIRPAVYGASWLRRTVLTIAALGVLVVVGCGDRESPPPGGALPKMSAAFDAAAQAGQNALEAGDAALAGVHFATALKEAAAFPETDPRVAMTWMFLGTAQTAAGDFPAADTSLQQARTLAARHQPPDPALQSDIGFRLGELYRQQQRADDADRCLTEAASALKPNDAAVALLHARILRSRALVTLLLRAQPAAAEPLFQASLERLQAAAAAEIPIDPAEACALRNDYATCCLAQQKFDPAAALLAEAAALEQTHLPDSRLAADTHLLLGKLEFARKNYTAAETHLAQALSWFEKSAGLDATPTLFAQRFLAEAHLGAGHQPEALSRCESFAARYEARTTPPQPGEPQAYAWMLNCQASLYMQANQLEKALSTLEKLQQFYEKNAGPESRVVAQTCSDRAVLLKKLSRLDEAAAAEKQAQAILAKQPAPRPVP